MMENDTAWRWSIYKSLRKRWLACHFTPLHFSVFSLFMLSTSPYLSSLSLSLSLLALIIMKRSVITAVALHFASYNGRWLKSVKSLKRRTQLWDPYSNGSECFVNEILTAFLSSWYLCPLGLWGLPYAVTEHFKDTLNINIVISLFISPFIPKLIVFFSR